MVETLQYRSTLGAFKVGAPAGALEAGGWRRSEVVAVPGNCRAAFPRRCHRDEPHCDARDDSSASVKAYTARPTLTPWFLDAYSSSYEFRL